MAAHPGLRRAYFLALGSLAVSCGSETIDLLPSPGNAGAAGQSSSNGGEHASAGSESKGGGNPVSEAGHGGKSGGGGSGGNAHTCAGGNCGGFSLGGVAGSASFGGTDGAFCIPGEELQCGFGFRCDVARARCVPLCKEDDECQEGRFCDKDEGACVACVHDFDCEFDADKATSFCHEHHCVECLGDSDCERKDPNLECDVPRGRCE